MTYRDRMEQKWQEVRNRAVVITQTEITISWGQVWHFVWFNLSRMLSRFVQGEFK